MSFTLLDEYRRTILIGARLQYNITEWLSVGVWGGYGIASLPTALTSEIDSSAPRNVFTKSNVNPGTPTDANNGTSFVDQTAKMNWVAAPQLQFTPFRGKLAIFQKIFVDTDAYLHGGAAFVGIQERAQCGSNGQVSCSDPSSFGLASSTKIAPTFGLGLNFYINNFMSIGLEYRALPFAWDRAGFDTRGGGNDGKFPDNKITSADDTFKFNQMMTISLGFSLPAAPTVSSSRSRSKAPFARRCALAMQRARRVARRAFASVHSRRSSLRSGAPCERPRASRRARSNRV